MSLLIKICGLKTPDMIDAALEAGVDLIGFVHFARSPRHLDLSDIGRLIRYVDGRAETVILTVNPDEDLLDHLLALDPDYIQLHGQETVERVAHIKERGVKVIKALAIGDQEDLAKVPRYADKADLLILDAKAPENAAHPGGNGEVFDWTLLKALDPDIKFMLSGGLTIDNVEQAIRDVQPFGLDLSSGVEVRKGEKDAGLIKEFMRRARA
ncbi:phosphoribosylanthranilate isomerase [Maritalea mediterranea]|uniref:N-(5'-phosphoribosyl)anthranilate isomerase n=1 Tax=Maritalea mediterranea TaxID=2909667 RepID=A0ABS9E4T4_9HYPH|nr:phosphoribosylanthranilate isomerase [Maritalea mediterranea]MCF4097207.1 phosphoribosylanthranilate isomerase [Maritalea mediterranea]